MYVESEEGVEDEEGALVEACGAGCSMFLDDLQLLTCCNCQYKKFCVKNTLLKAFPQ